ncbi:hypothetical protein VTJ49DRAFT_7563 [Mycothermus thermophilus]|uniref:LisH domain-containing protein n=1 Tax=Humicola insolens TaxID=85995 RepID=A0ABR3VGL4_HUMIN
MDPETTDPNLLLLSLNLSDLEPDEAAAPTTTTSTSASVTIEHQPTRAERTALSEEAFQKLKRTYRPKVENGDLYKSIPLPLHSNNTHDSSSSSSSSLPNPLSKPEAQALLHAVEELYFFKRYETAVEFLRGVLGPESDEGDLHNGPRDDDTAEGPRAGEVERDRGGSRSSSSRDDGPQHDTLNGSGTQERQDDKESVNGKREKGSNIDAETGRLLRYYLQRCLARSREGSGLAGREVTCH